MALSIDKHALRNHIERSLDDLPAMPAIVAQILELSEDTSATTADLDALVSSDPATAAKVLQVVNSAYYGLPTRVGSTAHAIMILGFRQIRNVILSMAAMSLVKSKNAIATEAQVRLWKHSFGSAAVSNHLSKLKEMDETTQDQAHIGALLGQIGLMYLFGSFPELYTKLDNLAVMNNLPMIEVERQAVGIDHIEVGEILASSWNFPTMLTSLIARKQSEGSDEKELSCHCVVEMSNHLATCAGFPATLSPEQNITEETEVWFGLEPEQRDSAVQFIQSKVQEAEELFGII
jgi:HD-like signal output (HDOD) protein